MLNKLPKHLLKYIDNFVNPTKEQMEQWKIEHYINHYKVLHDIKDIITEIRIGRNGNLKCFFSLFSWSLLDTEFFFDYDYSSDEEN